ncbi:MAG: hypothetical protein AB1461_02340 [Thermodesulfobacteriota bacterium]
MDSPRGPRQFQPTVRGKATLFLALGLAMLLLVAASLGSLHHHADLKAHADCAICLAVHHCPAAASPPPSLTEQLSPLFLLLFFMLPAAVIARRTTSVQGRAPPF